MATAPLGTWSSTVETFRPGHTQLTVTPGAGGLVLVNFSGDAGATWYPAVGSPFSAAATLAVPPSATSVRAQGAEVAGTFDVFDDGAADDPAMLWRSKEGTIGIAAGATGETLGLATAGQAGTALTASGESYAGACEFWGIEVSEYDGGPQTIVVTDDADGSGDPIATFVVSGIGFYPYSGDWTTPGGGQNLSRGLDTGVYLTISGGTSRTVAAIVTPI